MTGVYHALNERSFIADLIPEDLDLSSVAQADTALAASGLADTGEGEGGSLAWWLVGLVAAIVTAASAVLLVRQEQKETVAGFEIEE